MSLNRTLAGLITTTGDVKSASLDNAASLTVYSTLNSLPTSSLTAGDQAYVLSNRRFYISNGSGWYNVALANASPSLTVSDGSVVLATDGVTPTVITLTATDSDNPLAAITYTVESDGSFGGLATLSQDSSVFTITPLSEASATTTSSTLTFKASDGISFGTGTTVLSLTFGVDWSDSANRVENKIRINTPVTNGYLGGASGMLRFSGDGLRFIAGSYGENSFAGVAYVFVRDSANGIFTEEDQLALASPPASGQFGRWLDINYDGTYAVVSTNNPTGAQQANVFTRSGSTWTHQSTLTNERDANDDYFGICPQLDSSATHLLLGGRYTSGQGRIWYFTRSGSTWTDTQLIEPPSLITNSYFAHWGGISMNSAGNKFAAGYSGADGGGAVCVYTRSGSTWTLQAEFTDDSADDDAFGGPAGYCSISMSDDGNYIVIGAPYEDGGVGNPITNLGAAYIYARGDSDGAWTQQAKLSPSGPSRFSSVGFGYNTAINGDGTTVIVGHTYDSDHNPVTTTTQEGRVTIFQRQGETWSEATSFLHSDPGNTDRFGGCALEMNTAGDQIIVSTLDDGPSQGGAVYNYIQS